MIKQLIKDIEEVTGLKVTPERTTHKKECIVYSLSKEYDTGCVCQYRLTINLMTKTVAKAAEIDPLIANLLITKGDEQKYDEILGCTLGGGGSLYDTESELYATISYYDIITKSKVDWRK